MGIRTDICDEICKETVTKIHGQPTSQNLTNLEKEIIAILANITLKHDLPSACTNAKIYIEKYLNSNNTLIGYHYV